jgi:hypothetical protein
LELEFKEFMIIRHFKGSLNDELWYLGMLRRLWFLMGEEIKDRIL